MRLLFTVITAALVICAFYLIGGWAQHQLDLPAGKEVNFDAKR